MVKTASPTSSTRRTDRRGRAGFTLVELIVGSTIGAFVMAGVLSTFLMLLRTGANAQNYTEIEAKARAALETFSREVRLAYDVTNATTTSVTLSIPDTSSSRNTLLYSVTYTLDTTNNLFTRTGPPINNPTGASTTTTMIQQVQSVSGVNPFNYYHYVNPTSFSRIGLGYTDGFTTNTASTLPEIKQIEINFLLQRTNTTVTAATNKVLSARFILRNK